ncbi:ABC transporter permease [Levilactobacillus brevis]|uniref:ABC transporter permease n=1 Tax=Levilactobacillus brevis TaxID=1580 RepID=UPI000D324303|nr:ABC transporter permease [Levilactobacillus brevis]MBX6948402.1 ABC transporter permease [Levilactobacillus brevis]PTV22135.1 ABC transporter permease [Levilactobacillus brevis]QOX66420.1 ABC transporter permease [Levilactobacillus brevis]
MHNQLDRLIWRRHRRLFLALGALALFANVVMVIIVLSSRQTAGAHQLVGASIHHWATYKGDYFTAYSYWLIFVYWLAGLLLMNQDLKDNFNQFLFTSGFSRQRVYWTKLRQSLVVLLGISIVTIAVQYSLYWLMKPHGVSFTLAWPGLLTSWISGLAVATGLFAICWFAALIIGQTGALIVTVTGFTLSLMSVGAISQPILTNRPFSLSGSQLTWLVIGVWLIAAIILFVWGAVLYQHLSLEHNGEYLMVPRLKRPVYLVFVIYVTGIFSWGDTNWMADVVTFLITVIFGYAWLWRPRIGERLHQWRARHDG